MLEINQVSNLNFDFVFTIVNVMQQMLLREKKEKRKKVLFFTLIYEKTTLLCLECVFFCKY